MKKKTTVLNIENVIKRGIENLDELKSVILYAKNSKQLYREAIQEAIVYFVKNYNGSLTYNTSPFKAICECVGKDAMDLRNFLFTYTNITKIYSDLLHFETEQGEFIKGKDGKETKVYTLSFKETFAGQKWYATADKTDKETLEKVLTNEDLMKSLKAIFRKYTKSGNEYDTKEQNILNAIKTAYGL